MLEKRSKGKSIYQPFTTRSTKIVPRERLREPRPLPGAGAKGIVATQ
jgi:hypothetical protein